ncbi:uncharacterized protein LOC106393365 [Brassica napus]|uniref:uncharacterized protein LOC106393365 n=1 Tax=Brassica napus TaxID=3708 RepID=UPI00207A5FF9|nr:uncharacterized protein LOC106393365 [Brassica napus]
MDVAEVKSWDYPPRLYPEGSSNLEKKDINHNFRLGNFPHIRETIGLHVWEEMVNSPIGIVARLAGCESVWFSLLEFGEITGLNTGPLPTERFEPDQYKEFWEELKVPLGMGPKLDELKEALAFCPLWSFEKRYSTMKPWGRTAYEVLIDSIKTLAPEGGSYTISGMTVALLIWAYESSSASRTRASFDNLLAAEIKEHGEVRVRRIVLKDSIEEMYPKWPGRFVKSFWEVHGNTQGNAQGKGNEKKKKMKGGVSSEAEPPTKKQKKVKTQNESEVAAAGKGFSEKEGSKDLELENKATLRTIVSTLDNISRKFEQFDSQLEAYELDRNIPLMDQKTIDDSVKALLEERLKVLGVGKIPENNDNPSPPSADKSLTLASPRVQTQQNSVNSPALAATPVSPSKATKDDKDAKVPAYGRGCRGKHIVKGEEADEKKKAAQADASFKRKEKAEAKKKATEAKKKATEAKKKEAKAKKKEVEDKKKEAEGKKKQKAVGKKKEDVLKKRKQAESKNKEVTPYGEDSVFADVTNEVVGGENEFAPESDVEGSKLAAVSSPAVFPYVGENGTACVRKTVTPSSVIYDPLAPVDPVLLEKLMQHIKEIPPKPPAPADKPAVLSADHEGDFYSILIHERPWPEKEYGGVFDNGKLPDHCPTNLKWYEDVDHLYGCLQTGGNHWVAYHVDLKKEKIDCYDPIFGEVTHGSEQRILNSFKPLMHMIPYMLSEHIPANIRAPSKKKFSFRRRSKRCTPQNTQIGDCGVYSLKFVECLALGVTFDGINDKIFKVYG